MTRVLLLGPGAIGLTVGGAVLQRPEMALAVAARTPFDQMVVALDDERIECDVPVLTDPFAITGPFHLVLLATKAHQTPDVARWLDAACGPDTDVLVLQNGITHRERVEPLIGPASLVPAVVNIPADRGAPGQVNVGEFRQLIVPDSDAGRRTMNRFRDTFLDVETTDDWTTAAWRKLILNAVVGTITVLTRTPNSVLADPEIRELAIELAREVHAVAIADGALIEQRDFGPTLDIVGRRAGDHMSSITTDRVNGVPSEWHIRNHDVVTRARRHGVDIPLFERLTTLVRLGEPIAE